MSQKWWVLSAVACGTFMATLDSSCVNIALPSLTSVFDTSLPWVKWVIVVYLLTITALLLPFGRVADLYGRKRTFVLGFMIFTLGSALCGLAPYLFVLILARVIQAIGATFLMANGPAIITANFPVAERGKALGILAMVVSLGLVTGPSLGGLLISYLNWRSIFFINIPFGIAGIVLSWRSILPDPQLSQAKGFDWVGAFLQCLILFLLLSLFDPPTLSISGGLPIKLPVWISFPALILFSLLFYAIETRLNEPIFDMSLLKSTTFWSSNVAGFLMFVAYSTVSVLMPFFMEKGMDFSTRTAGMMMTAVPIAILVSAPLSGRFSDRYGSKEICFIASAIEAISFLAMGGLLGTGIESMTHYLWIIAGLAGIGLATGLFQSPNNNAIMGSVPSDRLGNASALLATVRNLGFFAGATFATATFSWKYEQSQDMVQSLHFTHILAAGIAFLAMLASLGKRKGPFWKTEQSWDIENKNGN